MLEYAYIGVEYRYSFKSCPYVSLGILDVINCYQGLNHSPDAWIHALDQLV